MQASWDRVKAGSKGRNANSSGGSSSTLSSLRGKEGGTRDKGAQQINKLMGRESSTSYYSSSQLEKAKSHTSAPLTSLTDPSLFPPPPRHAAVGPSPLGANPGTLRIGAPPPVQPPRQQLQIQHQAYVQPQPQEYEQTEVDVHQQTYVPPPQQQVYTQAPQQQAYTQAPQQQAYTQAPQQQAYTQAVQQEPYVQPIQQPVPVQTQQANKRPDFRAKMEEEEPVRRDPPGPFQRDTTGFKTDHLPPPPRRAGGPVEAAPVSARSNPPFSRAPAALPPRGAVPPPVKVKPAPPPRLPPRQNSHPDTYAADPPPVYTSGISPPPVTSSASAQTGYLNASAMNRLGQAGVSVPGFNIAPSSQNANTATPPPAAFAAAPSQVNELQARFARMQKPSSSPSAVTDTATTTPSNGGTTWAQKQAAIQTAANFHKDPSSVSWKDARAAASTANNFRERHGEQVAQGYQKASAVNQKYGVANKLGGFAASAYAAGSGVGGAEGQAQQEMGVVSPGGGETAMAMPAMAAAGRKPPPPPPKKKTFIFDAAQVQGPGQSGDAPPPLPLSSKPR